MVSLPLVVRDGVFTSSKIHICEKCAVDCNPVVLDVREIKCKRVHGISPRFCFLEEMILPEQGIKRWLWVIFDKNNSDEVIGCVDLWREGCPENRGFWLAKEHWGEGFMTEAVNPVMDYAFNQLDFEKLVFANAVGNNRSRRIKEKTGAIYIENRTAKFVNPEYKEHEIWELTKEKWNKLKTKD